MVNPDKISIRLMQFLSIAAGFAVLLYIIYSVQHSVTFDDRVAYECAKHGNEFNRVDIDGRTNGTYECLKN